MKWYRRKPRAKRAKPLIALVRRHTACRQCSSRTDPCIPAPCMLFFPLPLWQPEMDIKHDLLWLRIPTLQHSISKPLYGPFPRWAKPQRNILMTPTPAS